MKKFLAIILTMVMTMSLMSCTIVGGNANNETNGQESSAENAAAEFQTVQSTKSSLKLEVPVTWNKLDLNPLATIQMGDIRKEQYLCAIEEPTIELVFPLSLDEYSDLVLNSMLANYDTVDTIILRNITIGNGIQARQIEFNSSFRGTESTNLFTFVKTDEVYYQILTWSTPSKYDAAKPVFESILARVRL